jgi:hypothetical protein
MANNNERLPAEPQMAITYLNLRAYLGTEMSKRRVAVARHMDPEKLCATLEGWWWPRPRQVSSVDRQS